MNRFYDNNLEDEREGIVKLMERVIERAQDIADEQLWPSQDYEEYVMQVTEWLRNWTKYAATDTVGDVVNALAKAFLCYVYEMYGEEIDEEPTWLWGHIDEGEYEAFSECLRADVARIWTAWNGGLVGMREFKEIKNKNKN